MLKVENDDRRIALRKANKGTIGKHVVTDVNMFIIETNTHRSGESNRKFVMSIRQDMEDNLYKLCQMHMDKNELMQVRDSIDVMLNRTNKKKLGRRFI